MLDSDRFDWFASISLLFMPSWSVVWESLVYPLAFVMLIELILEKCKGFVNPVVSDVWFFWFHHCDEWAWIGLCLCQNSGFKFAMKYLHWFMRLVSCFYLLLFLVRFEKHSQVSFLYVLCVSLW